MRAGYINLSDIRRFMFGTLEAQDPPGFQRFPWGYPSCSLFDVINNPIYKWMMTGGTPMTQETTMWAMDNDSWVLETFTLQWVQTQAQVQLLALASRSGGFCHWVGNFQLQIAPYFV